MALKSFDRRQVIFSSEKVLRTRLLRAERHAEIRNAIPSESAVDFGPIDSDE